MILLETKGLSKKFGGYTALQDVNLTLECGKIVGLLGPNGSGKTTLLKLFNGLLAPTSGTITIGGYEPGVISKQHGGVCMAKRVEIKFNAKVVVESFAGR